MLRSVRLEDYMQDKPVTVAPETPLFEAVDLIISHKVSGLCVTDTEGTLLGVLSELDCLRGILRASYEQGAVGKVSDYMTASAINSARADNDIINVAEDMLAKGQRRRPVINEHNKLVGQITCRQILAAVRQLAQ